MKSSYQIVIFLMLGVASFQIRAASLPSGLVGAEIDQIIDEIGFVSTTRLLRSAESYPPWPGVRVGVDISVAPQMKYNRLGDKNGSESRLFLLPRFHFAKGLWGNVEIIFSSLPFSNQPGYSATGGLIKWTFYEEKKGWLSVATFVGYTWVSAFREDYTGNNLEFGLYASKDFVRARPYLGAAVLIAQGKIRSALAKTPTVSSMRSTLHAFIGVELEYPVTIAAEFGLFNLNPSASLLIGKRF